MAFSFLRSNIITKFYRQTSYVNKRPNGYLVLIPEIGEDGDASILLTESGLPEFTDLTIEKCIAAVSNQSFEYENGVREIESTATNSKNAFIEVFQPLEKFDNQLELTWGVAKTLYLGNSSLMPTQTYIKIHERAHKARSAKFHSNPIFQAAITEKGRMKKITDEEQRLLDKYILEGKLNGLDLKENNQEILKCVLFKIQEEKSVFRDKVNYATKVFSHTINDNQIVREFPESLLRNMAPKDPYKGPWRVSLHPLIYEPFIQYCPDRNLRCTVWNAHIQRCSNYLDKDYKTVSHLEEIRSLKRQQANLLGFETFADLSMETKMAGSVENVNNTLDFLLDFAKPMQEIEIEALQKFAMERGFEGKLDFWDIPYWQRKQRWSLYEYDEEKIREYFPYPKVVNSLFNLCSTLFKINIVEKINIQTWHKDVKFYEIFDESSNRPIAGFYVDPYAREDDKMCVHDDIGWHVPIRSKCTFTNSTPLSTIIFNFQPPVEGKQSLLTFSDVCTLFHKFGHTLRHLLAKTNYSEVAGLSNVEWDAAETCGHVLTHWLYDQNTLQAISGHYTTDEQLPETTIKNLQNAKEHMAGNSLCKELYLSKLDLELYSTKTYWREIVQNLWPKYHTLPFYKYDSHVLSFTKIVSEDWAAAYYSQLWSRMLASDIYGAFEEAKEKGEDVLDVGKRYKDTFLALGGSCDPNEVFRRFRGRDPSPQALLDNLGLTKSISDI